MPSIDPLIHSALITDGKLSQVEPGGISTRVMQHTHYLVEFPPFSTTAEKKSAADCSSEISPIVEFPPFSTLMEKNPQRNFPVNFSSILEVPPFSRRVEFAEWIFPVKFYQWWISTV